MTQPAQYEKIPVPGYVSPTQTYVDTEILYSTVGFTQKGVTLAGGQGILPAGTVLAQKASDKKYYVYNNAGSGGLDTARGILRRDTNTGPAGSADQLGNIVIAGILKNNLVSGADAAALVDLGATVDTVRNTFKF
jgi:hypothetical protein